MSNAKSLVALDFERYLTAYPQQRVEDYFDALVDLSRCERFGGHYERGLASDLREIIDAHQPASIVRLGDGEGNVLGIGNLEFPAVYGLATQRIMNLMFGRMDFSDNQMNHLRLGMEQAVLQADVLGIPSKHRIATCYSRTQASTIADDTSVDFRGIIGSLDAVRLTSDVLVRGQRKPNILTDCYLHKDLLPFYSTLLSGRPFVGIVSCHDEIGSAVAAYFEIDKVQLYTIPPQGGRRAEHYPDRFDELMSSFHVPEVGAVFLVSAGILGKLYCTRIKDLGGIAIDIGSVADVWMDQQSRAYHSPEFLRKWRLVDGLEATTQKRVIPQARLPSLQASSDRSAGAGDTGLAQNRDRLSQYSPSERNDVASIAGAQEGFSMVGRLAFDLQLLSSASYYNLTDRLERQRSNQDLVAFFTLLQQRLRPAVTFEIGAFNARFSIDMCLAGVHAIAFEANPHNFEYFMQNRSAAATQVEYLNIAVGRDSGATEFNIQRVIDGEQVAPIRGNNSLLVSMREGVIYDRVAVPCTSLDDFIVERKFQGQLFSAWIDVEGAAGDVLQGASSSLESCLSIMVEVEDHRFWRDQWLAPEVMAFLLDRGFMPVARDFEFLYQYNLVFIKDALLDRADVREALTTYHSRAGGIRPPKSLSSNVA